MSHPQRNYIQRRLEITAPMKDVLISQFYFFSSKNEIIITLIRFYWNGGGGYAGITLTAFRCLGGGPL